MGNFKSRSGVNMTEQSSKSAEQAYAETYFIERRRKEIRRFIIAVTAMVIGLPIAGFAGPIAGYLEVSEGAISTLGLVSNLCGFAILAMWVMDGKDYVFQGNKRGNVD